MLYLARSENRLCKTFEAQGSAAVERKDLFKPGVHFQYEGKPTSNLHEVAEILRLLLDDPYRAIVMGKPLFESGERNQSNFADEETDLWFIDLDGVPTTPEHTATIERCLPFLRGKRYVYAYSQSAGIKPGLRARVICKLPRPMKAIERAAYARHYNDRLTAYEGSAAMYIDSSIYTRSRLLFTSRPRLIGLPDPYPDRVFISNGEDTPIELDELPKLVAVSTTSNRTPINQLPRLVGFGQEGSGHDRSIQALKAIGCLRGYMGEDRWENSEERLELWQQMLRDANATEYELQNYTSFVNQRAKDARVPHDTQEVLALENPDLSVPLAKAIRQMKEILGRTVSSPEPRVVCVQITMGAGKTYETLRHLKAEHDRRNHGNPLGSFNVDLFVPTMLMAEETRRTAKELKLAAFVEYGRSQVLEGELVCIKADSATKLQGNVESVAEAICDNGETRCPNYDRCRWQWQRHETQEIPLRIRAHNHLALSGARDGRPGSRQVDFVVVDEASFVSRMVHFEEFQIAELIARRLKDEHYDWVLRFAKVASEGLTLERLHEAGFTADTFRMLIAEETSLRPIATIDPSMSAADTSAALSDFNSNWSKYANVWRCLLDCVESQSMNRIRTFNDGSSSTWISLAWKSPIKGIPWDNEAGRPKVPVLVLSGTMRREVIERFLPVDEWHEIDVAPHPQTVIEQSDLKGSKAECLYGSTPERQKPRHLGGRNETEVDKIEHAKSVRQLIKHVAADDVLITYKELEEQIGASGHFYAVEGINNFSGRDIVVYGRPLPPPPQVEQLARAIFCDDPIPIEPIRSPWYPKRPVARRGPGYGLSYYHPDMRVEHVRWMICEGEIMQAIGRSRYIRQPVRIRILNDTPLPLKIDRATTRHRLDPTWQRVETSDVLPLSQNEIIRLWPEVFKDGRTAWRHADERKSAFHESRAALLIEYRQAGQRGPAKRALVDGVEAIHQLGNLSQWSLVEDERNDWALNVRETLDLLRREPLIDDDGNLIELEDHDFFTLRNGAVLQIGTWRHALEGQSNLRTAST